MYFSLLQATYFKEDNPMDAMIIIIAIGAIVVVSILARLITRGFGGSSTAVKGAKAAAVTPRKFNAFTLHRVSAAYGLDKEQTKLLEYVFRNNSVSDPDHVMKNPVILDRHFKRVFKMIEKNSSTDEDAQQNILRLFALRNVLETTSTDDETPSLSITENSSAILACGTENYPVKILGSRGTNVVTDLPRNVLGTPVRISKGTKVTLSFFTKSSSGFSVDGQISGVTNTDRGTGLQITHSGRKKPLVKRKFRRRQVSIPGDLFFVNIVESGSGKKKTSKLVVDPRRFRGTVQDISVGGCSLKTSAPIPVGSRLKISIDYEDTYVITVLGQVLRSNRSNTGTILHVKFLKVPPRSYNSISSLVFGYGED